jgi:DNA-binding IclR family transcriptional regulator
VFGQRAEDRRTVAARLMSILGSFTPAHPVLSLAEISRRSGLPPSTTHRLVGELCEWGALERDDDRVYRIGPRLRELARLREPR